ncbi:MAG: ABC transporter ATPase [Bacteroidia bacterium]
MISSLSGDGRIWIYVAKRTLNDSEVSQIKSKLADFCSSWAAHGNQLSAGFEVYYNQILVLAVDENVAPATGCSIDSANATFQEIETEMGLDLFNRMNLAFVDDERVRLIKMNDLNQAYRSGLINEDSRFLDNTISTLADFRERWEVRFDTAWAYKRIKVTV